jgi:hypothetical protein
LTNPKFAEAVSLYDEKRYNEAFPLFETLAGQGHSGARYYLGLCYFTGSGIEQDNYKAAELLSMAAAQGHQDAQDIIEEFKKSDIGIKPEIDYQQKFDNDFHELFTERLKENEDFGCELWSSMANVTWYHLLDLKETDCGHSFRGAGALIADMLGKGDYIDWYCSGPYETVSDYIALRMASKGWYFELAGGDPGP